MDVPPSQTIYVGNLYEKLPKEGKSPPCCRSMHQKRHIMAKLGIFRVQS
jgi:hypothetical protein